MEQFLNSGLKVIMEQSVIGVILVWYMVQHSKNVKKLFTIIENNTKAMAELKTIVSKCPKQN